EAVETLEGPVHLLELFRIDAADLLDRADVALVETTDHFGDLLALRRQADANRATVDARALVVDEAEIDELLQVVGHVRAEVVAARAQLARRQLGRADIEQQKRLDGIDVAAAVAVELILDHVEQAAMQPLDELKRFEVKGTDRIFAVVKVFSGLRRLARSHHGLASRLTPVILFFFSPWPDLIECT